MPFLDEETAARLLPCAGSELSLLVTFAPASGASFKAHPMEIIKLQAGGWTV
jgi:hypothetical protein